MKKFLLACSAAIVGLVGLGAGVAQADPSVTACYSVSISVNGQDVADAACNTAP
jgi:hypothetical protein